jgi:cytochrome c oxidase assembly protein subunit 15
MYGGLLLVIMQIALGAWTAANYAAVACTDLPTCQGQWWPEGMDFQHGFDITQQVGPNYLGGQLTADGRVAIHVTHRLGAVIVLGYFLVLLALLWRHRSDSGLDSSILLVAAALLVQIGLGLANVWLHIPLAIAVAHNAMGAGLLLATVHLIWQHRQLPQPETSPAIQTTTINREVTA